ncbi:MAG: hypothetical protein ACXWO1_20835, partial [Isosphaeraceae bacterium]
RGCLGLARRSLPYTAGRGHTGSLPPAAARSSAHRYASGRIAPLTIRLLKLLDERYDRAPTLHWRTLRRR